MNRILGIDYGGVRVGIAMTDPLCITVNPHETLQNDKNIMENIYRICKSKAVNTIVIGVPYDENNNIGESASAALRFAEQLNSYLKSNDFVCEFYAQDERYTTRAAYEVMNLAKVKTSKKKMFVDSLAAAEIIKEFLGSRVKEKLY